MRSLTLRSPAKLNLYLKILNKRPDGYHNIVTLFERIDLSDYLQFKLNRDKKIRIFCDHPDVPNGPKNLVYRVAQLLREKFAIEDGVDVTIRKNIPVAAGLAGGSSNAATTLLGLNQLWKLAISKKELLRYARQIGADVAFFIHNCSWGLGTERGDIIQLLPLKRKLWHVLVVPKLKMYSGKVYEGLNLKLTNSGDNVTILIHNLQKNNLPAVGRMFVNDLESSIFCLCPKLLQLKERIFDLRPEGVLVSGSGPAVFGITKSKQHAENLRLILQKRYRQVFVVGTL